MKRRMLKKMVNLGLALIFVLTAMLSLLPPDRAMAAGLNIAFESDGRSLEYDDDFDITIKVTNNTEEEITVKKVDLSGASHIAIPRTDSAEQLVEIEIADTEGPTNILNDFSMVFVGDGNSRLLPVTIVYEQDGSVKNETRNFPLDIASPSDDDYSPPFDSTPYKPSLEASVDEDATVMAGQYTGVKLTLKNTNATTYAKNVVLTPIYESDSPFTHVKCLTDMPIKEIRVKGSQELTLSVNTDKFSDSGIYPFKFKLSYTNPWGDEFTSEHIVYINVKNNKLNTKLTLQTSSADNVSAAAGKDFLVPVYIVNSGSFYAKDISVTLTGLSQESFMLRSGSSRMNFDRVRGDDFIKFDLNLTAAKGLRTASYPIAFKVEYTTEAGDRVVEDQEVWIPVTGSGDSVNALEIIEVKPSKTTVSASDVFDVSVTVKNSGTANADQIKVSADGTNALLPVSQNLFIVSKMAPGGSKTLSFKFQPSPDAQRGSVPIVIKVESLDGSGNNTMLSQAVSVFVDADASQSDPNKNVPKIIVESYTYDPQQVNAGEQFTLNMAFLNTHSSKTIRNIKGSFNVEEESNETGNVFTPVDCSNTFFIDEIKPKDLYDWTLNLYTIPDALSKTYTVIITFDYEDEQGNPYTAQEIIGIPVYQPSRFEVSEISMPSEAYMGDRVYVQFSLYNMGKTDLYNVKMSVQGDFAADPMSTYFGNFTPGYMEWCDINLMPMELGMGKGKIVVEYETTSGELMSYEKEFSLNVMEMPMMDPGFPVDGGKFPMEPGMDGGMEEEGGGFFGSVWFFIILGVVVAGIVVTIIIVKKRKKDKEFEF